MCHWNLPGVGGKGVPAPGGKSRDFFQGLDGQKTETKLEGWINFGWFSKLTTLQPLPKACKHLGVSSRMDWVYMHWSNESVCVLGSVRVPYEFISALFTEWNFHGGPGWLRLAVSPVGWGVYPNRDGYTLAVATSNSDHGHYMFRLGLGDSNLSWEGSRSTQGMPKKNNLGRPPSTTAWDLSGANIRFFWKKKGDLGSSGLTDWRT